MTAGTRLGPYEMGSALVAGGMGEVYGAHDSRRKRDVAFRLWFTERERLVPTQ